MTRVADMIRGQLVVSGEPMIDKGAGELKSPETPTSADYLTDAWRAIAEASAAERADERFELSHVAAVRAASALIADATLAGRVRRCSRGDGQSLWRLVADCVPELAEWADFFAASAPLRKEVRGRTLPDSSVPPRMADDLLRDADRFTHEVRAWLLRRRTRSARERSAGTSG